MLMPWRILRITRQLPRDRHFLKRESTIMRQRCIASLPDIFCGKSSLRMQAAFLVVKTLHLSVLAEISKNVVDKRMCEENSVDECDHIHKFLLHFRKEDKHN